MQLLNSPNRQQQNAVQEQLLDIFNDIVHKVEIHPNFSIQHPNYKPFELPNEIVSRFQKLPESMQKKYLSLQLRSFLYGIYYNGAMKTSLALDGDDNNLPIDLENNTFLGVDLAFYEQLHQSNQGQGYFDPGWLVVKEESDGGFTVTRGGLKLYIEPDKHLELAKKPELGTVVAVRMPKNLVQNGFYMAVGNQGANRIKNLGEPAQIVRVYFNLTPQGAVAVMGTLTQKLNERAIPFSFKVLYNPKEYGRSDSAVLYFEKEDYEQISQVLQIVYQEHSSDFEPHIPLFTMRLAPGMGLAEQPDQQFAQQESFGMNRCQIVANGLIEAWETGNDSPQQRLKAIFEQFSHLGMNWQQSYLNSNSENIYRAIDYQ